MEMEDTTDEDEPPKPNLTQGYNENRKDLLETYTNSGPDHINHMFGHTMAGVTGKNDISKDLGRPAKIIQAKANEILSDDSKSLDYSTYPVVLSRFSPSSEDSESCDDIILSESHWHTDLDQRPESIENPGFRFNGCQVNNKGKTVIDQEVQTSTDVRQKLGNTAGSTSTLCNTRENLGNSGEAARRDPVSLSGVETLKVTGDQGTGIPVGNSELADSNGSSIPESDSLGKRMVRESERCAQVRATAKPCQLFLPAETAPSVPLPPSLSPPPLSHPTTFSTAASQNTEAIPPLSTHSTIEANELYPQTLNSDSESTTLVQIPGVCTCSLPENVNPKTGSSFATVASSPFAKISPSQGVSISPPGLNLDAVPSAREISCSCSVAGEDKDQAIVSECVSGDRQNFGTAPVTQGSDSVRITNQLNAGQPWNAFSPGDNTDANRSCEVSFTLVEDAETARFKVINGVQNKSFAAVQKADDINNFIKLQEIEEKHFTSVQHSEDGSFTVTEETTGESFTAPQDSDEEKVLVKSNGDRNIAVCVSTVEKSVFEYNSGKRQTGFCCGPSGEPSTASVSTSGRSIEAVVEGPRLQSLVIPRISDRFARSSNSLDNADVPNAVSGSGARRSGQCSQRVNNNPSVVIDTGPVVQLCSFTQEIDSSGVVSYPYPCKDVVDGPGKVDVGTTCGNRPVSTQQSRGNAAVDGEFASPGHIFSTDVIDNVKYCTCEVLCDCILTGRNGRYHPNHASDRPRQISGSCIYQTRGHNKLEGFPERQSESSQNSCETSAPLPESPFHTAPFSGGRSGNSDIGIYECLTSDGLHSGSDGINYDLIDGKAYDNRAGSDRYYREASVVINSPSDEEEDEEDNASNNNNTCKNSDEVEATSSREHIGNCKSDNNNNKEQSNDCSDNITHTNYIDSPDSAFVISELHRSNLSVQTSNCTPLNCAPTSLNALGKSRLSETDTGSFLQVEAYCQRNYCGREPSIEVCENDQSFNSKISCVSSQDKSELHPLTSCFDSGQVTPRNAWDVNSADSASIGVNSQGAGLYPLRQRDAAVQVHSNVDLQRKNEDKLNIVDVDAQVSLSPPFSPGPQRGQSLSYDENSTITATTSRSKSSSPVISAPKSAEKKCRKYFTAEFTAGQKPVQRENALEQNGRRVDRLRESRETGEHKTLNKHDLSDFAGEKHVETSQTSVCRKRRFSQGNCEDGYKKRTRDTQNKSPVINFTRRRSDYGLKHRISQFESANTGAKTVHSHIVSKVNDSHVNHAPGLLNRCASVAGDRIYKENDTYKNRYRRETVSVTPEPGRNTSRSSSPKRNVVVRQTRASILRQLGSQYKNSESAAVIEEILRTNSSANRVKHSRESSVIKDTQSFETFSSEKRAHPVCQDVKLGSSSNAITVSKNMAEGTAINRPKTPSSRLGERKIVSSKPNADQSRHGKKEGLREKAKDDTEIALGTQIRDKASSENVKSMAKGDGNSDSTAKSRPSQGFLRQTQSQLSRIKASQTTKTKSAGETDSSQRKAKDGTDKTADATKISERGVKRPKTPHGSSTISDVSKSANDPPARKGQVLSPILRKASRKENICTDSSASIQSPRSRRNPRILGVTSTSEVLSPLTSPTEQEVPYPMQSRQNLASNNNAQNPPMPSGDISPTSPSKARKFKSPSPASERSSVSPKPSPQEKRRKSPSLSPHHRRSTSREKTKGPNTNSKTTTGTKQTSVKSSSSVVVSKSTSSTTTSTPPSSHSSSPPPKTPTKQITTAITNRYSHLHLQRLSDNRSPSFLPIAKRPTGPSKTARSKSLARNSTCQTKAKIEGSKGISTIESKKTVSRDQRKDTVSDDQNKNAQENKTGTRAGSASPSGQSGQGSSTRKMSVDENTQNYNQVDPRITPELEDGIEHMEGSSIDTKDHVMSGRETTPSPLPQHRAENENEISQVAGEKEAIKETVLAGQDNIDYSTSAVHTDDGEFIQQEGFSNDECTDTFSITESEVEIHDIIKNRPDDIQKFDVVISQGEPIKENSDKRRPLRSQKNAKEHANVRVKEQSPNLSRKYQEKSPLPETARAATPRVGGRNLQRRTTEVKGQNSALTLKGSGVTVAPDKLKERRKSKDLTAEGQDKKTVSKQQSKNASEKITESKLSMKAKIGRNVDKKDVSDLTRNASKLQPKEEMSPRLAIRKVPSPFSASDMTSVTSTRESSVDSRFDDDMTSVTSDMSSLTSSSLSSKSHKHSEKQEEQFQKVTETKTSAEKHNGAVKLKQIAGHKNKPLATKTNTPHLDVRKPIVRRSTSNVKQVRKDVNKVSNDRSTRALPAREVNKTLSSTSTKLRAPKPHQGKTHGARDTTEKEIQKLKKGEAEKSCLQKQRGEVEILGLLKTNVNQDEGQDARAVDNEGGRHARPVHEGVSKNMNHTDETEQVIIIGRDAGAQSSARIGRNDLEGAGAVILRENREMKTGEKERNRKGKVEVESNGVGEKMISEEEEMDQHAVVTGANIDGEEEVLVCDVDDEMSRLDTKGVYMSECSVGSSGVKSKQLGSLPCADFSRAEQSTAEESRTAVLSGVDIPSAAGVQIPAPSPNSPRARSQGGRIGMKWGYRESKPSGADQISFSGSESAQELKAANTDMCDGEARETDATQRGCCSEDRGEEDGTGESGEHKKFSVFSSQGNVTGENTVCDLLEGVVHRPDSESVIHRVDDLDYHVKSVSEDSQRILTRENFSADNEICAIRELDNKEYPQDDYSQEDIQFKSDNLEEDRRQIPANLSHQGNTCLPFSHPSQSQFEQMKLSSSGMSDDRNANSVLPKSQPETGSGSFHKSPSYSRPGISSSSSGGTTSPGDRITHLRPDGDHFRDVKTVYQGFVIGSGDLEGIDSQGNGNRQSGGEDDEVVMEGTRGQFGDGDINANVCNGVRDFPVVNPCTDEDLTPDNKGVDSIHTAQEHKRNTQANTLDNIPFADDESTEPLLGTSHAQDGAVKQQRSEAARLPCRSSASRLTDRDKKDLRIAGAEIASPAESLSSCNNKPQGKKLFSRSNKSKNDSIPLSASSISNSEVRYGAREETAEDTEEYARGKYYRDISEHKNLAESSINESAYKTAIGSALSLDSTFEDDIRYGDDKITVTDYDFDPDEAITDSQSVNIDDDDDDSGGDNNNNDGESSHGSDSSFQSATSDILMAAASPPSRELAFFEGCGTSKAGEGMAKLIASDSESLDTQCWKDEQSNGADEAAETEVRKILRRSSFGGVSNLNTMPFTSTPKVFHGYSSKYETLSYSSSSSTTRRSLSTAFSTKRLEDAHQRSRSSKFSSAEVDYQFSHHEIKSKDYLSAKTGAVMKVCKSDSILSEKGHVHASDSAEDVACHPTDKRLTMSGGGGFDHNDQFLSSLHRSAISDQTDQTDQIMSDPLSFIASYPGDQRDNTSRPKSSMAISKDQVTRPRSSLAIDSQRKSLSMFLSSSVSSSALSSSETGSGERRSLQKRVGENAAVSSLPVRRAMSVEPRKSAKSNSASTQRSTSPSLYTCSYVVDINSSVKQQRGGMRQQQQQQIQRGYQTQHSQPPQSAGVQRVNQSLTKSSSSEKKSVSRGVSLNENKMGTGMPGLRRSRSEDVECLDSEKNTRSRPQKDDTNGVQKTAADVGGKASLRDRQIQPHLSSQHRALMRPSNTQSKDAITSDKVNRSTKNTITGVKNERDAGGQDSKMSSVTMKKRGKWLEKSQRFQPVESLQSSKVKSETKTSTSQHATNNSVISASDTKNKDRVTKNDKGSAKSEQKFESRETKTNEQREQIQNSENVTTVTRSANMTSADEICSVHTFADTNTTLGHPTSSALSGNTNLSQGTNVTDEKWKLKRISSEDDSDVNGCNAKEISSYQEEMVPPVQGGSQDIKTSLFESGYSSDIKTPDVRSPVQDIEEGARNLLQTSECENNVTQIYKNNSGVQSDRTCWSVPVSSAHKVHTGNAEKTSETTVADVSQLSESAGSRLEGHNSEAVRDKNYRSFKTDEEEVSPPSQEAGKEEVKFWELRADCSQTVLPELSPHRSDKLKMSDKPQAEVNKVDITGGTAPSSGRLGVDTICSQARPKNDIKTIENTPIHEGGAISYKNISSDHTLDKGTLNDLQTAGAKDTQHLMQWQDNQNITAFSCFETELREGNENILVTNIPYDLKRGVSNLSSEGSGSPYLEKLVRLSDDPQRYAGPITRTSGASDINQEICGDSFQSSDIPIGVTSAATCTDFSTNNFTNTGTDSDHDKLCENLDSARPFPPTLKHRPSGSQPSTLPGNDYAFAQSTSPGSTTQRAEHETGYLLTSRHNEEAKLRDAQYDHNLPVRDTSTYARENNSSNSSYSKSRTFPGLINENIDGNDETGITQDSVVIKDEVDNKRAAASSLTSGESEMVTLGSGLSDAAERLGKCVVTSEKSAHSVHKDGPSNSENNASEIYSRQEGGEFSHVHSVEVSDYSSTPALSSSLSAPSSAVLTSTQNVPGDFVNKTVDKSSSIINSLPVSSQALVAGITWCTDNKPSSTSPHEHADDQFVQGSRVGQDGERIPHVLEQMNISGHLHSRADMTSQEGQNKKDTTDVTRKKVSNVANTGDVGQTGVNQRGTESSCKEILTVFPSQLHGKANAKMPIIESAETGGLKETDGEVTSIVRSPQGSNVGKTLLPVEPYGARSPTRSDNSGCPSPCRLSPSRHAREKSPMILEIVCELLSKVSSGENRDIARAKCPVPPEEPSKPSSARAMTPEEKEKVDGQRVINRWKSMVKKSRVMAIRESLQVKIAQDENKSHVPPPLSPTPPRRYKWARDEAGIWKKFFLDDGGNFEKLGAGLSNGAEIKSGDENTCNETIIQNDEGTALASSNEEEMSNKQDEKQTNDDSFISTTNKSQQKVGNDIYRSASELSKVFHPAVDAHIPDSSSEIQGDETAVGNKDKLQREGEISNMETYGKYLNKSGSSEENSKTVLMKITKEGEIEEGIIVPGEFSARPPHCTRLRSPVKQRHDEANKWATHFETHHPGVKGPADKSDHVPESKDIDHKGRQIDSQKDRDSRNAGTDETPAGTFVNLKATIEHFTRMQNLASTATYSQSSSLPKEEADFSVPPSSSLSASQTEITSDIYVESAQFSADRKMSNGKVCQFDDSATLYKTRSQGDDVSGGDKIDGYRDTDSHASLNTASVALDSSNRKVAHPESSRIETGTTRDTNSDKTVRVASHPHVTRERPNQNKENSSPLTTAADQVPSKQAKSGISEQLETSSAESETDLEVERSVTSRDGVRINQKVSEASHTDVLRDFVEQSIMKDLASKATCVKSHTQDADVQTTQANSKIFSNQLDKSYEERRSGPGESPNEQITPEETHISSRPKSAGIRKNETVSCSTESRTPVTPPGFVPTDLSDKSKPKDVTATKHSDQETRQTQTSTSENGDDIAKKSGSEDQKTKKYSWPTVAESLKRFQKSIAAAPPRGHLQRGREQQYLVASRKDPAGSRGAKSANNDTNDKREGGSSTEVSDAKTASPGFAKKQVIDMENRDVLTKPAPTSAGPTASSGPAGEGSDDISSNTSETRSDTVESTPQEAPSLIAQSSQAIQSKAARPQNLSTSSISMKEADKIEVPGKAKMAGPESKSEVAEKPVTPKWSPSCMPETVLPPSPVITLSPEALANRNVGDSPVRSVTSSRRPGQLSSQGVINAGDGSVSKTELLVPTKNTESSPESDQATPTPSATDGREFQKVKLLESPSISLPPHLAEQHQGRHRGEEEADLQNGLTPVNTDVTLDDSAPADITITTSSETPAAGFTTQTAAGTDQMLVTSPRSGSRRHMPSAKLISVSVWDTHDGDKALRTSRRLWATEEKPILAGISEIEEAHASTDVTASRDLGRDTQDTTRLQAKDDCKERVRASRSPVRPTTKQRKAPRRSLSLPSGGLSYGDVKILYKDGHFVTVDTSLEKSSRSKFGCSEGNLEDVSEENESLEQSQNKELLSTESLPSGTSENENCNDIDGNMRSEILTLLERGISDPRQTLGEAAFVLGQAKWEADGRRYRNGGPVFHSLPRQKVKGQRPMSVDEVQLWKYYSKSQQSLVSQAEMERRRREDEEGRFREGSSLKRNKSFTEAMGSNLDLNDPSGAGESKRDGDDIDFCDSVFDELGQGTISEESRSGKSRSRGPGFFQRMLQKRKGTQAEKSLSVSSASSKAQKEELSASQLSLSSSSGTSPSKRDPRESSLSRKMSFRGIFKRKNSGGELSASRKTSSEEPNTPPIAMFLNSDDIGASPPVSAQRRLQRSAGETDQLRDGVNDKDGLDTSLLFLRPRSPRSPMSNSSSQSSLCRSLSQDDSDRTPTMQHSESFSRRTRSSSGRTRYRNRLSPGEHLSGDSSSEYDLGPSDLNSEDTLTPRSVSPCMADLSAEGDRTLVASPTNSDMLSPPVYQRLTASPQSKRRQLFQDGGPSQRSTYKDKDSAMTSSSHSVDRGDIASSNSNDSGIQNDANVNSSAESIQQATVRLRKSKSPSPTTERPKSDTTVRWADLLEQVMEPGKVRHRKDANRLRRQPRPKSDIDESMEDEGLDNEESDEDDEDDHVGDEYEESDEGGCHTADSRRSVLLNANSLSNISVSTSAAAAAGSMPTAINITGTNSSSDLRLLMQSRESLLSLVELRRPNRDSSRDVLSAKLAKFRRLSTPQPITVRAEKPKTKPYKQTSGSAGMTHAHSMPENLDKLTRKKNYFSLISSDAQSITSQQSTGDGEDSSDESEYSVDYHPDKSPSARSSHLMLTTLDQVLGEEHLTYAEALWDHVTMDPEELGFRAGDLIRVMDVSDKHWWFGVQDEHEGWFPATFVRLRVNQDVMEEELAFLLAEKEEMLMAEHAGNVMSAPNYLDKHQARANVVNEIISAEREYVKHLRDVVEGYVKQARKRPEMFPIEKVTIIFSNIEEIYAFATELLLQLEKSVNHEHPHLSELGRCFLRNAKGFEMYSDYCNNHSAACEELRELYRNKRYRHFFEACRLLQEMIEIPLEGFLLTPVQKICKYHLQLAELLKFTPSDHPDHHQVQRALEAMKKIAMLINERKRKMESVEKLAAWQLLVDDWEGPDILEGSSELIYSGELNKINHAGWSQERYFFLFDHQLIYCKKDLLKKSSFCYKGRISMDCCEVVSIPDGRDAQYSVTVKNAWKLHETRQDKWYLLVAKTAVTKQRWLKAFQDERRRVKEDTENNFNIPVHVKQAVITNFKQKTNVNKPKGKRKSMGHVLAAEAISSSQQINAYATLPRKNRHKIKSDSSLGKNKRINWFFLGKGKS